MKKILLILFTILIFTLVGCDAGNSGEETQHGDIPEYNITTENTKNKINLNVDKINSGEFFVLLTSDGYAADCIKNGTYTLSLNNIDGDNLSNYNLNSYLVDYLYSSTESGQTALKIIFDVTTSSTWSSAVTTNIRTISFILDFNSDKEDDLVLEYDLNITISPQFTHALIHESNISSSKFIYVDNNVNDKVSIKSSLKYSEFSDDLTNFESIINITNVYAENDNLNLSNIILKNSSEEYINIIPNEDNIADVYLGGMGTIYYEFNISLNTSDNEVSLMQDNIIIEYKLNGSEIVKTFVLCNVLAYDLSIL